MAESHREEIAKLEALYAGNPGGRVFVHLAEAYRKAGEHERARRILDEGLARHTDSASGYVVLGRVLADMQIGEEAEVAFRRVLELDSGNLVALRWLGDLARQSGRSHEAVAHYRDLLSRNPSNEEVRDLVEIVEREVAGGAPEAAADEPEWQEPEPVEQVPEAPAEPLTSLSAAPGRTGDEEPAEVEFGLVEIEALTVEGGEPDAGQGGSAGAVPGPTEPAPSPEEDSPVIESYGEEDAEGFAELSGLARSDEADPLEIHLLDPSYAGDEEQGDEYADDEFIADLMTAAEEPPEPDALDAKLDVLESGSALTLQDRAGTSDHTAASEQATEAHPAGMDHEAPPEIFGGDFALDPDSEPAHGVEAAPSTDEAPTEEFRADAAPEPQAVPFLPAAESEQEALPLLQPHGDELGAAALGGDEAEAEPGLVTETMAELYRAQGFHERAADVYRALLRQRPFDLKLSAKLSEAEADAAEAAAERASSGQQQEPDDEAAGAVWLRGVGSPWDSGTTSSVESANPYTWTPEPEDQPAGAPISSYLRDLVSWKTAGQRWAEAAPPAPPPAAPAQPAASWSPDDEPWAGSPVDDAWGSAASAQAVDPWGGAPESSSLGAAPEHAAAGAEAAAESVAPEAAAEPTVERPGDTSEGTASAAPNAEPADPWLQGTTETADPWAAVQASGGTTAQPTAGWTPVEEEPTAGAPPPPAEDGDTEDEDLEMFRSWLQSLKK